MAATARKSLISVLAALLCAIAAAAVCATAPSEAFAEEPEGSALPLVAQDGLPASSESGTCTWTIDADGVLTIAPTSGSTGQLPDWGSTIGGADWYGYRESIRSVRFNGTITAPTCCYMFYGCKNLTSVDLTGLNTASASNLSGMFSGCSSLETLNLAALDTSHATKTANMFYNCSSLSSLTLWSTSTQNVTTMAEMFSGCSSLASIDLSALNTTNVTSMLSMFSGCSSLTSLSMSSLNTEKVTDMSSMFSGCSGLTSLSLFGLSTSKVTDMSSMFSGCSLLTTLDVSPLDTTSVTNMSSMFRNCSSLASLDLTPLKTSNVRNMSSMFSGCSGLAGLDLSPLVTTTVTNMSSMFQGCSSLTSLNLTPLETPIVRDMSSMFAGCSGLTSLDLAPLETTSVTNMSSMFSGCSGLAGMDLSPLVTTTVTNMSSMFQGCSSLTSLDLSPLNTTSVTNMASMFSGCSGLASLDASTLVTTNVTNMSAMFQGCSGLKELALRKFDTDAKRFIGFDTAKVTSMESMFKGCSLLAEIDLSSFVTSKTTNTKSMFEGCSSMKSIFVYVYNNGVEDVGWVMKRVSESSSSNMFLGCTQLVGEVGTTYDPNHVTSAYAHIDAAGNPGYLKDARNLNWAIATIYPNEYTYTGDYVHPDHIYPSEEYPYEPVVVTLGGVVLLEQTDYSVEYTNNKAVGTATATIVPCSNQIYHGSTSATFEIVKAPVTVTVANKSKALGARDPQLEATVVGDTMYSHLKYTLVREEGENAGEYAINVELGDNPGYDVTVYPGTFTINKGTATVTANNASKFYGDPDPELTATAAGEVSGFPVQYTLTRAAGETPGEYAIDVASDDPNYDVTPVGGTFTIAPASIEGAELSLSQTDFTYNGQVQKPEVTVGGKQLVAGTDYDLVCSPESSTDAGAYTVKAVGKGNCQGTSAEAAYTISPKSVTVTADDKTKTFGEADPALTVTVDGTINDEDVAYNTPSRAEGEDAGSYTIDVSGNADQGNYTVAFVPGTLTIGQKAATVTINNASKTFGDADPGFTAAVEGEVAGHSLHYTLSRAAGEDAGEYAITATSSDPNYDVTVNPGKLTISKRAATVTADGASKSYGDPDPKLTATVEGEAAGHPVQYTLTRAVGEVPGEYAIDVASDDPNYDVTPVGGTFTIVRASIEGAELSLSQTDFTYNGQVQKPEVTVGGKQLVAGTDYDLECSSENPTDVGTYTVKAVGKGNCEGTSAEAAYTISPKLVKVTAEAASKTYGAADPELTATVEGLIGSDAVEYTLSRAMGEDVGTYAITATGEAKQGNYTVSFGPAATFKIVAVSIKGSVIELSKSSFAYSGKPQKPKVKTIGGKALVEGRDYTLSYKSNVNAGTAQVVVTAKGNYAGTATKSFRITKAKNSAKAAKTSVLKTIKASKLKKVQYVALPKVTTKFGKYVWKPVKKDAKGVLSVKSGKVKVKKGAKKGAYTIKVKATVAGTKNYSAATTKTVVVKVTVK